MRGRSARTVRIFDSVLTISNGPTRSRGACLRPRFATLLHRPRTRGGRSAERRSGACEAPVGHAITRRTRRLARRLASHARDARLSALHRGGFGPRGRASLTGTRVSAGVGSDPASSSHPGRSAWRAGSRASRGERLRAARRRTPRLAPPSGSSPETPLNERGCECCSMNSLCSQQG